MKILTVCERNNNRSVALASILREERQFRDVISCGTQTFSPQTLDMLLTWADKVLIVASGIRLQLPDKYHEKYIILEGMPNGDIWGYTHNPDLQTKLREEINKIGI